MADPRAEGIVQDALNRVSVNKTTLVIAHKLSTVRTADNIVVMSYGKVIEQGAHHELIERNGQYAALVRAQDLGGQSGNPDFAKEEGDRELEKTIILQRTKTDVETTAIDTEIQHLTAGTLGYSLPRCIYIILSEQKNLYAWFFISGVACLIAGGTFPANAIVDSHLIRVFTLSKEEGRKQADFWSLMLFIVAIANLLAYFAIGWVCNIVSLPNTTSLSFLLTERLGCPDCDPLLSP